MCEKLIICLLLIWHVLGPLKTLISVFVRARARVCVCVCVCVCQNEGECMRERERERERGAIHVLLIHSIVLMTLYYAIMIFDTLISARPLRCSLNPRLSGLGFNTTLVF